MRTEFKSPIKSNDVDELFSAVLELKSLDECYRFFDDLCTYGEVQTMALRYRVARMLTEGKTYVEISAATGASTATITRVNKSICYGADGYKIIFGRLNK